MSTDWDYSKSDINLQTDNGSQGRPKLTSRRFVLLDRDGTIIVERNYLSDPDDLDLIPGAAEGLRHLSEMGLGLVLVTNQSAVGRGYFDESKLDLIHERLRSVLCLEKVNLDGIYHCPHTPETKCRCRKPEPGLVELAAKELGFDPEAAFVVGDKACDIELGKRIGATTLLVRTGYGARTAAEQSTCPDYVVEDVEAAARKITMLVATDSSARQPGDGSGNSGAQN